MKTFASSIFQYKDHVWIYDVKSKSWSEGPSLNVKRSQHVCIVDPKTKTIHVIGGWTLKQTRHGQNWKPLKSTETLNEANSKWEMGPDIKKPLLYSAAVSSRSNEYIGYIVGGNSATPKLWALRRRDMEWIEISKHFEVRRMMHSLVNVKKSEKAC